MKLRRKLARIAAARVPLSALLRRLPPGPIGFFYHLVSDDRLAHVSHLYAYKSTAEFEADLVFLKRHFTLVGYPALVEAQNGRALNGVEAPPQLRSARQPLPEREAYLSFDDGFTECYTEIRPRLLAHNIPAIFFLPTDVLDNRAMLYRCKISLCLDRLERRVDAGADAGASSEARAVADDFLDRAAAVAGRAFSSGNEFGIWLRERQQVDEALLDQICGLCGVDLPGFLQRKKPFLTTEQIRQMQAEGFTFGAHSRKHAKLGLLPRAEQAAEIVESCRIVSALTGTEQVPFAFPFSGNGVDRNFLDDLQKGHPVIGQIFDSQRLAREPGVRHRIWADRPVRGIPAGSNLEYWLRDAYVRTLSPPA